MRLRCVTLEPDGTATGCNPVQVGSTPTGVFLFHRSAAVWRRIDLPIIGFESECRRPCPRSSSRRIGRPNRVVPSLTVENYVKTIALIAARDPTGSAVGTGELAQALNVSPGHGHRHAQDALRGQPGHVHAL